MPARASGFCRMSSLATIYIEVLLESAGFCFDTGDLVAIQCIVERVVRVSLPIAVQYSHAIMSLPQEQSAIVVHEPGGVDAMLFTKNYPVLDPHQDHVIVRNAYCGINYVDIYFRNGFYQSPKPEVLGREGTGTIVALGPSSGRSYGLREGDRVAWLGTGGYATYSSVPIDKVVKLPDGIPLKDACACFLSGLTALALVDEAYKVKAGDWVLLHAAAGTVGILMVQILKHLGARVIGTAGGAEKCQVVKDLGADHVIDYRDSSQKPWPELVKEITGGDGVDIVYDSVAKDTWEGSLEVVRRKGTVVWFGNASGPVPPLTLQYVLTQ